MEVRLFTLLNIWWLVGSALCLAPAWAQGVSAGTLLERAKAAHGGAALSNLRTYQETATLTTFQVGQPEHTLSVVSYVDFKAERLRIEYRDGRTLIQVIQFSPQAAQSWSAQRGTQPLGAELAQDLRNGLYQNWYGLRLGSKGRQEMQLEGEQTFADVTGLTVRVRTQGATTTYLFDSQGRLRAERTDNSQGRTTVVYGDLKSVEGVLIPFQARLYANGALFAEAKIKEARVNPPLGPATWKMP
ncbi:hypothetical protein MGR01S_00710 [Meiothermus granaticius NBRC 107808]|uniref:Outer membrane lipoprotein-sorting protein n=1 Tax=Meiothermus granaticius NBRC 107808 TaxID=1227551 RepID=A0A399F8H7_9DEIN|nr:hypothetical protein Mgrana_02509 [Meiothermus granaticius NBRC 107808]GEM85446.1 hypothetical protein MGR01S_00710 [Meiothermus granaticius NBRC 107808]